jgi:hypothetical protein
MTKERNIENAITQMARAERTLAKRVVELEKHLSNMILAAETFIPDHPVVLQAKEALGIEKKGDIT